jgi:hypothetical protein
MMPIRRAFDQSVDAGAFEIGDFPVSVCRAHLAANGD